MDQAEVSIHKVEVQMQTLPSCGFDKRALIRKWLLEEKRERATGFKDGENAHQAMLDSVALGKLSRRPSVSMLDARYRNGRPCFFAIAIACLFTRWEFSS